MWSRRKEEEYTPRPSNTPHNPAESNKESVSMPPTSSRPMESEPYRPTTAASIGKSVMIKGQIISREDLYFDGELEGTVELQEHRLTIGPNGRVKADVKAREICIIGSVQGNVDASDKIEIRKEAKLVGDVRTARIVIEDGAYFKGSIDIIKQDVSKPQPAPAPPARPQTMAAAASGNANTTPHPVGESKR